jgi:hypothetical protein
MPKVESHLFGFDAYGCVILNDDQLIALEGDFRAVSAAGAINGGPCTGTNNDVCSNTNCSGSTNDVCGNSGCGTNTNKSGCYGHVQQ